jgi:hypothetical protein
MYLFVQDVLSFTNLSHISCVNVKYDESSYRVDSRVLAAGIHCLILLCFPCYDFTLVNFSMFDAVLNFQQEHEVGQALVDHLQVQSTQHR